MSAANVFEFPQRRPSFDAVVEHYVDEAIARRDDGQLLTLKEAAGRLAVCPNTLTKLIKDYGLPVVTVGGSKRIRQSALLAFIEANE